MLHEHSINSQEKVGCCAYASVCHQIKMIYHTSSPKHLSTEAANWLETYLVTSGKFERLRRVLLGHLRSARGVAKRLITESVVELTLWNPVKQSD